MIDNYFIPPALQAVVEAIADRTGNTQFIGMCHHRQYESRVVDLADILTPHPIFADFRDGKNCSWTFGPTYAELKQLPDLAVVLHVQPDFAKIAAAQRYGTPAAEAAALGYGQGRYQGD